MQGSEDFAGNTQAATIEANTKAKLSEVKNPRNTFKVKALNKDDLFLSLRLGNTLALRMQTVGFDGTDGIGTNTKVRIIGMRYSDAKNVCELTVDEVLT